MKKKIEIEIDDDNIIDIALNMLIVATATINTAVEFRSQNQAKLLDAMTRKFLAFVMGALDNLNIDREQSYKTLSELKKIVLY